MDYDLGYIDLEEKTLQPLRTPSGQSVTHLSGTFCYPCLRNGQIENVVARDGVEPPTPAFQGASRTPCGSQLSAAPKEDDSAWAVFRYAVQDFQSAWSSPHVRYLWPLMPTL